jgi:hypothetical protein
VWGEVENLTFRGGIDFLLRLRLNKNNAYLTMYCSGRFQGNDEKLSDFKRDMMACSCDVVRNFVVIMCFCYWLGENTYILGKLKGNFMLGNIHCLLGNFITKLTKQILPLSILFVSPYGNTSFVCICGGEWYSWCWNSNYVMCQKASKFSFCCWLNSYTIWVLHYCINQDQSV